MVINEYMILHKIVNERIETIHDLGVDDLKQVFSDVIIMSYGIFVLEEVNDIVSEKGLDAETRARAKTSANNVKAIIDARARNFDKLTLRTEEPE